MQEGDGFLLIFSLESRTSFQDLKQLQQQVLRVKDADSYPMLVVGNKSDCEKQRQVSTAEGKELAALFDCRYIETSAKLRHNVEEAFHGITREIKKYRRKQKHNAKGASKRDFRCLVS